MIKLTESPVIWRNGVPAAAETDKVDRSGTMAYRIICGHRITTGVAGAGLSLRFDALISHDITYVGIVQTALASGLRSFSLPYVLTNCHNSLCAEGGTINADDHAFGLSAARRFGGVYVPANMAVIHQYARETLTGCGRMILGSDSHTRYGPLGTMGVGEGGPELVKQLLGDSYDIAPPRVVLVYLTGSPARGVGPHDVAIALCGAVYRNGFVKNCVMEFAGPGIADLPMDYRIGIDVMTTETACLSSIWETDGKVEEWLAAHGRADAYKRLAPSEGACYDALIEIDLSRVEPMAALPFHPSEAYTLRQLISDGADIMRETERRVDRQFGGEVSIDLTGKLRDGRLRIDQGIIAGCAGGMYDNIAEAAAILGTRPSGCAGFDLSVYPPSAPVAMRMLKSGLSTSLMSAGAIQKPCFCGPCFGAGDVPSNGAVSARHTTRNFPNREGSKPMEGQLAAVMLMDARSIAATALCGGLLTPATEIDYAPPAPTPVVYDSAAYDRRVYVGTGRPTGEPLKYGPNIAPWPEIPALSENLLMVLATVIRDEVTTTDELIPSGDTSSYRSNPIKLAQFALSRKDARYVPRTAEIRALSDRLRSGDCAETAKILKAAGVDGLPDDLAVGSVVFARRPGDGSAREQAASCQRVLGGCANICWEYATKRYRSNCINWGLLPFTSDRSTENNWQPGDYIYVSGIRSAVEKGVEAIPAKLIRADGLRAEEITLRLEGLIEEERQILLRGCLMNWYSVGKK